MTQTTFAMEYPRLRQDITFLETADGLYVRGAGLNFVIRGAGTYALLSNLLPHLDGTRPIADSLASLPDGQQAGVIRFLQALRSKGLLHEGFLPDPAGADPVLDGLHTQRALLADLGADPRAISRVVDADVVVLGSHPKAAALTRCLTGNGVGLRRGSVSVRPLEGPEAAPLPPDALVVALCVEEDAARALSVVDSLPPGHAVIPVWQSARRLLIGPWQGAQDGPVLRSAIARASANATPTVGQGSTAMALGLPFAEPPLGPAAYEALGALLGLEIFKILGGVDDGALRLAVLAVDVDTLQVTRQPVALHPGCFPGVAALPVTEVRHPVGAAETPLEQRYRRFASVVGDPCGLFTGFDDDSLPQLPIKIGRLTGGIDGGAIIGTDLRHVLGARARALGAAAAQHALAQARIHLDAAEGQGMPRVPAREIASWLGSTEADEALVLAHGGEAFGTLHLVPRSAVLASPQHRAPAYFGPDLGGVGTGDELDDAVSAGLLSAWAHAAAVAGENGILDLREVRMDPLVNAGDPTVRGLDLLRGALGGPGASVRLLAPDNGAPMAVACLADVACWAHGESWLEAAESALSWLVARDQLASIPRADDTLRFVARPFCPRAIRLGAEVREVDALVSAVPSPAEAVRHAGFDPLYVDLTSPDLRAVARVARVLLRRRSGGDLR